MQTDLDKAYQTDAPLPLARVLTPLERIEARFNAMEEEREALKELIGDPVKALALLLADIPREILERNFIESEDGSIHVRWSD